MTSSPKNWRSKFHFSGAFLFTAVLVLGASFWLKGSGYLFPGPLSAMHPKETPLNGYVSHAEFEQECLHCHAPIHCVTDTRCQDCHQDIARQRAEGEGLHSRLPIANRCQTCHPEHRGRDIVITEWAFNNVDHRELAGFSLVKHTEDYDKQPLNCESCHSQERFASETLDCLTCHAEGDHEGLAEHLELYGPDCLACHDGEDRMAIFDHNQVYPLAGGHTDLACVDCHVEHNYRTGPLACVDCHADPEVHLGTFGLECDRCHTDAGWKPAALTRHLFPLDHGGEGEVACETCHEESYVQITCYGCHDHEPEDMRLVHGAEGIEQYENCAECHPTGVPGEAGRLREQQADPDANAAGQAEAG